LATELQSVHRTIEESAAKQSGINVLTRRHSRRTNDHS
jgi:hypothetical protein